MTEHWKASLRALILDMDGVLWRGAQPLGDLPAAFRRIAELGWRVIMATNNATRTPDQYLERLHSYGVVGLQPWQVINSAQAAAHYLRQVLPEGAPVYVVGEGGLCQALLEQGFTLSAEGAQAVVAALDRELTYAKLRQATLLVRGGALFVATNSDPTYPDPVGEVPGAGAIVAALEAATGQKAVIAGKPEPHMYRVALERLGVDASAALVVGDRLSTDIAGAQPLGCRTAVVLSGISSLADVEAWSPPPDLVAPDLNTLLERF